MARAFAWYSALLSFGRTGRGDAGDLTRYLIAPLPLSRQRLQSPERQCVERGGFSWAGKGGGGKYSTVSAIMAAYTLFAAFVQLGVRGQNANGGRTVAVKV